ncbi:MAG: molecular chaperone DnaJ [bacterium]|nr:molecular chaperone DnaJ [bacterium]
MPGKDYYNTLGVSENAAPDEIKRVYRDLAKKFHPDANRGDKQAENRFKEISEAYNVLRDPEKRKKYDQMRKYGFSGGQAAGFDFGDFDFGQFSRRGASGRQSFGGNIFEELFNVGGLGDIFGDMFDQGRRRSSRGYQTQKNRYTDIIIPFDVAVSGGKQTISVNVIDKCDACNGTGAEKGVSPKTCPQCQGRGTISLAQGFFAVNRTCPRCMGRGIIIDKPCSKCQGSGDVNRIKKLALNIPKGVEDGALLRLKGLGNNGTPKAAKGDLIVKVKIAPHRFFKRKGNDIYCEVPIDNLKAEKGTKIRIRTVNNKKVELKVPAGTRDQKMFRLKGHGIQSKKRTGDQYVTIKVINRSNSKTHN